MKNLLLLLAFLSFTSYSFSQVTSTKYQLRYNANLEKYEVYLYINEGSATTPSQRIQFNSQVGLVVPHNSQVVLDSSYMPLIENANYDGIDPATWLLSGNVQSPAVTPELDYYAITVLISPAARHNNLFAGQYVKLFSLNITTPISIICDTNIRLWENGLDPDANQAGMMGNNFDNGFTVGTTTQLYSGNLPQVKKGIYLTDLYSDCVEGTNIYADFDIDTNQGLLTYTWQAPSGAIVANTQDLSIVPAGEIGIYNLIVNDSIGCIDTFSISSESMINAGNDTFHCAGLTYRLKGSGPSTGNWKTLSGNPSDVELIPLLNGEADVLFPDSIGGSYFFIYYKANCADTVMIRVDPKPQIAPIEPNVFCIGSTISVTAIPAGGTWSVENPTIASIDIDNKLITISAGTTNIIYISALGCRSAAAEIIVNPDPIIGIVGTPFICEGQSTQLTPATSGWTSSNNAIVSISNSGLATGISAGSSILEFTDANGCTAEYNLTVLQKPVVGIVGNGVICGLGGTADLSPSTGGTWSSPNNTIASITNTGLVTGINAGCTTFTFMSDNGCISDPSPLICVEAKPDVSADKTEMCIGETASLIPSNGTWSVGTPSILTLLSSPLRVRANAAGLGKVFHTSPLGCFIDTVLITVHPKPVVTNLGDNIICVGGSTQMSPTSGGTWVSNNPTIINISNSGLVTGNIPGSSTVLYTDSITGCSSSSTLISVIDGPLIDILGASQICIGETTTVAANGTGSWASSNIGVAAVNDQGLVTGIFPGVTGIQHTDLNGCHSQTIFITVYPNPYTAFTGPPSICVGQTTNLLPSSGGTWVSDNPAVAIVSASGVVAGIAAGQANMIFTDGNTACSSNPLTVTVTNSNTPATFIGSYGPYCITDGDVQLVVSPTGGVFMGVGVSGGIFSPSIAGLGSHIIKYSEINGFCFTEAEIIINVINCGTSYNYTGTVFRDENGNGVLDSPSDFGLNNGHVYIPSKNLLLLTNAQGIVTTPLANGIYDVIVTLPYGTWQPDTIYGVIVVNNSNVSYSYGFKPLPSEDHSEVAVNGTIFRCNQWAKLNLSALNFGTNDIDGSMVLILDPRTYARNAMPTPNQQNLEKVTWTINDLHSGESRAHMIEVFITPAEFEGDSFRFITYFINSVGDTIAQNYYADMIRCSYDPNDKRSWPDRVGEENYTLRNENLTYTIRFQNTGNDTAFYVRIDDIIDPSLDISSLMVLHASHDVMTCYEGNGVLSFIFNDIELIDSMTDVRGSEGFVTFRIDEYNNVPENTEIRNIVDIIFDQNIPIVTNTVRNTIVSELPCIDAVIEQIGTSIFATEGGSSYAWYNCNNDTLVLTAESNGFSPLSEGFYYVVIEDIFCNAKSECILFDINAVNVAIENEVQLWPNPSSDKVYINSSRPINGIKLFDNLGRNVNITIMNNEIDIEDLMIGIYYLAIAMEGRVTYRKIVKR